MRGKISTAYVRFSFGENIEISNPFPLGHNTNPIKKICQPLAQFLGAGCSLASHLEFSVHLLQTLRLLIIGKKNPGWIIVSARLASAIILCKLAFLYLKVKAIPTPHLVSRTQAHFSLAGCPNHRPFQAD
jgi:hypothetical protein